MAHKRQRIRDAVVTALSGRTAAGTRVYPTRFIPARQAELPVLAVYTLDESVDPGSINNLHGAARELTRDLRLTIEGLVHVSSAVDATMDDLAVQIERAMDADETFGDVCGRSMLESTEPEIFKDGDRMTGLLRMTYVMRYYSDAPDASDVALQPLKTIDARYGINGMPLPRDPTTPNNNVEDKLLNLDT